MTNEEALDICCKALGCVKCLCDSQIDFETTVRHYAQQHDLEIMIGAIMKQIPKKPIIVTTSDNECVSILCPCCKKTEIKNFGLKYTDCCGQAIDWSEDVRAEED